MAATVSYQLTPERRRRTSKLTKACIAIGAMLEDRMAVGVEGQGNAAAPYQALQQPEVAAAVLLIAEGSALPPSTAPVACPRRRAAGTAARPRPASGDDCRPAVAAFPPGACAGGVPGAWAGVFVLDCSDRRRPGCAAGWSCRCRCPLVRRATPIDGSGWLPGRSWRPGEPP